MTFFIRTWMFAILLFIAFPAHAQQSAAGDNGEGDSSEAEAQSPSESESDHAPGLNDWTGVPARVETLGLRGLKVLVSVPQLETPPAAIQALDSALSQQDLALKIDDSALGVEPSWSDSQIVEAASNQPVDRVLIVRFFPPAPTMIVTSYRTDATGAGNFALERGDTSAPTKPTLEIADEGESAESVENPDGGESETPSNAPSAEELRRYETERWTLESFDESGIVIRHGATGESLAGPAALELLGQDELAATMRENMSLKRGLYWTGAAVAGAGLVSLLIGFFTIPAAFQSGDDIPTGSVVAVVGGFGGIFAGIITAVVGWNIDAIDATRKEARGWIDTHNAPLRDELSIPPHLSGRPAPTNAVQLSWAF